MGDPLQQQVQNRLVLGPAVLDHAYALEPCLRAADRRECAIVYPEFKVAEALRATIEASTEAWTICDEQDVIHGLWGHGVTDVGTLDGFVWLMSDDYLFTMHAVEMTRRFRKDFIPYLDSIYKAYGNDVSCANTVHIRWLSSAGFETQGCLEHNHKPFTRMYRGR